MSSKILWSTLIFLAGWLWYFLIVRQFVINLTTVIPMLKRFNSANKELMSINANRFVKLSIVIWFIISIIILAIVLYFTKNSIYLGICFIIGGIIGIITFAGRYTPSTESNFNDFCSSYYRFVFDDELRTYMYKCKINKIKKRLKELEIDEKKIVPVFKN